MAEIQLNSVCKNFDQAEIIKDVTFGIERSEFVVFVGPSGCGKSTLLRLIAGLEDISSGELLMDGQVMNEVPPVKRDVAMVFQSYALYPHMNVYENMAFGLRNLRIQEDEIKRRVKQASDILQIDHLMGAKPKDLSGGQRQRVAIGRTIVREPRVFLFDEPLSNLDAALRVQMRIEMTKLHQRLKTTMVYVTHDQVEAMTLANRIVVLNDGRVEQIGAPLELYEKPANIFVAGFIGSPSMNFIKCKVAKTTNGGAVLNMPHNSQALINGLTELQAGAKVTLGVRPEAVFLNKEVEGGINIKGDLVTLEELGNTTYGYVEIEEGTIITCQANRFKGSKQEVTLGFSPADCYVFDSEGKTLS